MNCLRCGREAGYNRVVIDLLAGTELGRLCMNCEKDQFGECLEYFGSAGADDCAFCERDGHFALARWLPSVEDRGDRLVCTAEVERTDTAVKVCDEHFHEIADVEAPAERVVR